MSALVGALTEAWAELRHHKLRVLLSLIGIAVSVGAIAVVVALGDYQRQSIVESSDRYGGRDATIAVSAQRTDGQPLDAPAFAAQMDEAAERFGFTHVTRRLANDQLSTPVSVQTSDYVRSALTRLVDPAYPVIHRSALKEGRWFTEDDLSLQAPPIVVSEGLWTALGAQPLTQHPVVELTGPLAGEYRVIGVTPAQYQGDTEKTVTLPMDTYLARGGQLGAENPLMWEVWVPADQVADIGPQLAAQLRATAGDGVEVFVSRTDWASRPETQAQTAIFELITGAVAGLVLLLGGLGLVNIQLVAMRQRIREIGVRRSFGATAGRIFTTVLLESVVATTVAGVVGIVLAVAILQSPLVQGLFSGMQDIPAFPVRAAVTALVAAVAIGAVAGFLPALAAVRAKVIDALRF